MALELIVTNAGRAALVNAAHDGTGPKRIAQIGVSSTAVVPSNTAANLPGELKRLASISGDVVGPDMIHVIMRDDTTDAYPLRSFALYLDDGTLFGIYGQADIILDKTSASIGLLAIDVQLADINAAALTFGDTNFLNPPATETRQGVAKIATQAIASAGADDTSIVTPKKAKGGLLAWLGYTPANKAGDSFYGPVSVSYNNGANFNINNANSNGDSALYYSRTGVVRWALGDSVGGGLWYINRYDATGAYLSTPLQVSLADGHATFGTTPFVTSSVMWHAGNDGAGSGLDADMMAGVPSASYARRDQANTYAAGQTISCPGANLALNTSGGQDSDILFRRAGVTRWAMGDSQGNSIFYINLYDAGGAYITTPLTIRLSDGLVNVNALSVLGNTAWHMGNDGAGSGLDADLLDGQDSSYYVNIPQRLGYTPVQQGTGVGQLNNAVKIGWSGSRIKATVDTVDQGPMVSDAWLNASALPISGDTMQRHGLNLWGPDNDGSGSGLDADLLDGHHASDFALAQSFAGALGSNGYQQLPTGLIIQWGFIAQLNNQAQNTFNLPIPFPNAGLSIVASLGTSFNLSGNHIGLGADFVSKSQARIAVASDSAGTIGAHWIAIGY